MPYRETTIDLAEEIERLETECQEIAEQAVTADSERTRAQLVEQGAELDTQLDGVRWALHAAHDDEDAPAWDEQVEEVTLAALRGGEFGRLEDDLASGDGGRGTSRVRLVAAGTVEAPYVDSEMSDKKRVAKTASLPHSYLRWAEARVNDAMRVGDDEGNEKGFADWLQDAQAKTNSAE